MTNYTDRIDELIADDDLRFILRDALISRCNDERYDADSIDADMIEHAPLNATNFAAMMLALNSLIDDEYARDELTELLLSYSLCPLHAIDYAICFDDDDAECAPIRIIHPSHDT